MRKRIIKFGDIVLSEREKQAIREVCDSNRISEGKKTKEFEKNWAEAIGTKYAVSVNSGTSGLIAGLYTLKYLADNPKRTKVITTPLTFIATSNAIKIAGLEPVFGDVDRRTFGILPSEIEKILSENNPEEFLAILPVHLMGYPCDMDKISPLAKKNNLYIFEDAAQAHGTVYNGRKLGSIGDLSNFSFYIAHNVQVGEFGAVNTSNNDLNTLLRKVKAHGKICACPICIRQTGKCPEMKQDIEDDYDPRYTHDVVGFNFKTNEFMSALAVERLKHMDKTNEKRREIVQRLNESLAKFQEELTLPVYSPDVSYLGYPIILKSGSRRNMRQELENRGIETRTLFGCIPSQQPSFSYLKEEYAGKLPNADYASRRGFFIGCHQEMNEEDITHIEKSFEEITSIKPDKS